MRSRERLPASAEAMALLTYPRDSAAASTRSRFSEETWGEPLMASETVARETPASAAMSAWVA